MERKFLVILLWTTTVYQIGRCATAREKPKRNQLSDSQPHPYTISFFTFPNGAASELLKSKIQSKRQNEDLQSNQDANKPSKHRSEQTKSAADSKTTKEVSKTADGHLRQAHHKTKHPKPYVQVYETPTAMEKAGKALEVGPQKGHQKMEPWKLGPSHNKIQFKVRHMKTDDTYQTGSINHPSHTTYPECHHCPNNSSYDDCTSKNTLVKCNKGLNNICFTKSVRSAERSIVYEMGCSSHNQCRKAKASPCKGNAKKCFVCCQYNRCNAEPHHQLDAPDILDEAGFEFLNSKTVRCLPSKWNALVLVFLQLWMMS